MASPLPILRRLRFSPSTRVGVPHAFKSFLTSTRSISNFATIPGSLSMRRYRMGVRRRTRRKSLQRRHIVLPCIRLGATAQALKVDALPSLVLLDSAGKVRFVHEGFDVSENLESGLTRRIHELVNSGNPTDEFPQLTRRGRQSATPQPKCDRCNLEQLSTPKTNCNHNQAAS